MYLIWDVDQDPYRAAITPKLLELAKDLVVAVVAEGVETEEQWGWPVSQGADFAQAGLLLR